MDYNFSEIEKRWQSYWSEQKTFAADENSQKEKFYVLDMFPYPSGAGLHVGHPLGYIASDIVSRYKRHLGYNVLHPMGYDSFGLPAEQYAIQTGQHPRITTENNIATYRRQLDLIGFSYDWDREVKTSDPEYYKWTQWIFLQLFNSWYDKDADKARSIEELISIFDKEGSSKLNAHTDSEISFTAAEWQEMDEKEQADILMDYRLAYLSDSFVNWCPALGTVLANDEIKDGKSERGGHPVERKKMKQWSMRITAYAERLLQGLDKIDFSDALKEIQRNWIGKSEGASIRFKVADREDEIEVFTTRPDTIFGASFMVLAPEHPLVDEISSKEQSKKVKAYQKYAASRSERERMSEVKTVSGEFTGAYAIHPFTNEAIPIWIGDYVLAGYGTGAVMAVPSGDQRDWGFAKKFGLEIPPVIEGQDVSEGADDRKDGKIVNSDFLNGLSVQDAIKKSISVVEEKGIGKGKINYRLRDAVFSRQRYWGEPIPIYFKDGMAKAIPENELPLRLPEIDEYKPTETGEPPLARARDWSFEGNPIETSTMPGWAGSSWYLFRYMDLERKNGFASEESLKYWENVDLYFGGAEHATGHLLYSRFWTKFLFDSGYLSTDEPFKKLINQGMILASDGQKMSKRYGNVVNPDDIVAQYGADTLRLFEMFLGPLEQSKPWDTDSIEGVHRFLRKFWRLYHNDQNELELSDEAADKKELRSLHKCIKKVSEDIESFSFNTAVSAFMICVNELQDLKCNKRSILEPLCILLSPFAPHISEELSSKMGHEGSISKLPYPKFNEAHLKQDEVKYPVSFNGKMRFMLELPADMPKDQVEETVLSHENAQKWLEGKAPKKVIVVPGKIVNIVV
ncbi:MAG: leucine--tRNA ligase [Flavobacteriales bacterium]|nr:leucine--tRNA ligase [Flavobacteriales bacterium]